MRFERGMGSEGHLIPIKGITAQPGAIERERRGAEREGGAEEGIFEVFHGPWENIKGRACDG